MIETKKAALFVGTLWFLAVAHADLFEVTKTSAPGVDPQVGAIEALSDGRVAVAFHRGEILIYEPEAKTWSPFAEGLQEPLGLLIESDDSFLVMQRAELTRVSDTDGDGIADDYATVWDGFGLSGNYHEFAFGPVRDAEGNYYVALNIASNGSGVRSEIRGEWSDIGLLNHQEMITGSNWKDRKTDARRMYSRVPWRGWIMKLTPDPDHPFGLFKAEPYASGFRSPDGIGFDAQGHLLATDNQGDWRGTSPLYTVKKDGFYGHPASLVWAEGWDQGDPYDLEVSVLDEMRVKPTGQFPQGELANSPTQPLLIPETWGDYAGDVLIGDMNQRHLVRFISDEVNGFRQGALLPMMRGSSIGRGNHRFSFDQADGTLWVGKTRLSWPGDMGILSVSPPDPEKVFIVTGVALSGKGGTQCLTITFNRPINAEGVSAITALRYDYGYGADYGSPKLDEQPLTLSDTRLDEGGRRLDIFIENMKAGAVHEIRLSALSAAADGLRLDGSTIYYQASELAEPR